MALIYTANGQRSIDDSLIEHIIEAGRVGRYTQVTLVLRNEDVSGLMHAEACRRLVAKIDGTTPPMVA